MSQLCFQSVVFQRINRALCWQAMCDISSALQKKIPDEVTNHIFAMVLDLASRHRIILARILRISGLFLPGECAFPLKIARYFHREMRGKLACDGDRWLLLRETSERKEKSQELDLPSTRKRTIVPTTISC